MYPFPHDVEVLPHLLNHAQRRLPDCAVPVHVLSLPLVCTNLLPCKNSAPPPSLSPDTLLGRTGHEYPANR